jgi:TatD DNase family protein
MMLFDSHCHLTDEAFTEDLTDVLARARQEGVSGLVTIASDLADAVRAAALARDHAGVWSTAGVHPHVAAEAHADCRERLLELVAGSDVVAIGEAGLDYHYDNSPRDAQRRLLKVQLEIAAEVGLPVVVHSRDAEDDTAAIVRQVAGTVTGVLHCFTGGRTLLDTALQAGWFISFSGLVTFPRYRDADLLRAVPDERLLIETDSPYLAPVPLRGKRNEPSFLAHTCAAVARIRNTTAEQVANLTCHNAQRFYRLPRNREPATGNR